MGTPARGEPVKLYHGSLYLNPDGSLVLAYQAEGDSETIRRHIPAAMARLMIDGGSPLQVAKAMMRGRNGMD